MCVREIRLFNFYLSYNQSSHNVIAPTDTPIIQQFDTKTQFEVVPIIQPNTNETAEHRSPELVAELPEHHIKLYNADDYMVLERGDHQEIITWSHGTPRNIMPRLNLNDYDEDGQNELAVILYIGSGTGISVEELHIVELTDEQFDKSITNDLVFNPDDYLQQLIKQVHFSIKTVGDELIGQIYIGNETYQTQLASVLEVQNTSDITENMIIGNIISFEFLSDSIKLTAGLGLVIKNMFSPQYIGYIHSTVNYAQSFMNRINP